jgi:dienelactone hydrolase
MPVPGFKPEPFTFQGIEKTVYIAGQGPAVIIIHEIPGITPQVHRFAKWVVEAGFTVYLPHLFGTPMKPYSTGYRIEQIFKACISREFSILSAHKSSPIVDWLRALARVSYERVGGRGIGAIGMCITGNFALAMMLDEFLMAPVLSQPSLPLLATAENKRALHVSKEQIAAAHKRINQGAKILGLRFQNDPFCPAERFVALKEEFGQAFEAIELDPKFGNPKGLQPPHSVLTLDLIDAQGEPTMQAAERTIAFLKEQLTPLS